jgi:uncharacterized protein YbjT (DUF2867 family)
MRSAKTLLVGATGLLGREILRQLKMAQKPSRAVVRSTASQSKRDLVASLATEVVAADLKDVASLESACLGVDTVICCATTAVSQQDGDTIHTVDEAGNLDLVSAAECAGVRHFVFVSFPPSWVDSALQRAKRAVELRLSESRLDSTVLQPAHFAEAWLSPALGFDPVHGRAVILGAGDRPISWISVIDVARFAVAAPDWGRRGSTVLPLGGPDPLSPLQVLDIFEELGAPPVAKEHVPEQALEAQLANADDPVKEARAAIALATTRGLVIDPGPALALLEGRLITVRDYAFRMLKGSTR